MDETQLIAPQQAIEYIQSRTQLFPRDADLIAFEISGVTESVEGFVNLIYRVKDQKSGKSVVLKQVLPYIRLARFLSGGKPLSLERVRIEREAFDLWNSLCPGCVPQIYQWDDQQAIVVMEDVGQFKMARFEFARLKQYPKFASQIGEFLGKSAFYTSDLFLNSIDKKNLVTRFTNPDFRELYERVFFTGPFFGALNEPMHSEIRADVLAFRQDQDILREILKLRQAYLVQSQSLIHNDFHTSNILVGQDAFKILDGEAAGWGPTAYDLGALFGNLLLNCTSLQVLDTVSMDDKIAYEDYLLQTLEGIFHQFVDTFSEAWDRHAQPEYRLVPGYKDDYLKRILQDTAGYAGGMAFNRAHGPGMSYDFKRIRDARQRAEAQRLVLRAARLLILQREQFEKIEDITALLKQLKSEFRIEAIVRETLHVIR